MRLLSSSAILLVCVGLALASPARKKIEKKSISDNLAPKAIEPVEQKLDEESKKLSDGSLMEVAGDNVDRAKKQASTTFCVEIRQNKPTQVDCEELNPRPIQPEPQETSIPVIESVPPPQPSENYKIEVPCEPEIAPFYIQPPPEIVYAPTGNCAPQLPTILHVPSNNPIYQLPSGGGSSGTPSINVLHLHGGNLHPGAGHGVGPTIHISPSTGTGGGSPSIIPIHSHGPSITPIAPVAPNPPVAPVAPAQPAFGPSHLHLLKPSLFHHHGLNGGLNGVLPGISGGLNGALPGISGGLNGVLPGISGGLNGVLPGISGGIHGLHQLSGVECTCKSGPGLFGKSGDGQPSSNEALALKFLQDIQRNSAPPQSGTPSSNPVILQVSPGGQSAPSVRPSSGPIMSLSAGPSSGSLISLSGGASASPISLSTGKSSSPVMSLSAGPSSGSLMSLSAGPSSGSLMSLSGGASGSPISLSAGQPGGSISLSAGQPGGSISLSAGQASNPLITLSTGQGGPATSGKSDLRLSPVRPVVQPQVVYQRPVSSIRGSSGLDGLGGLGLFGGLNVQTVPYRATGGASPSIYQTGALRSNADCLQDSFGNAQLLPQGLRLSRDEAEAIVGQEHVEEKPEEAKPSPSEIMEAMKKHNEENNKEDQNARIARYLLEKNIESNVLDEN